MNPTPDGWYNDPVDAGLQRYWANGAWTAQTRSIPEYAKRTPPRPDPYAGMTPPPQQVGNTVVTVTKGSPRVFGIFLVVFGVLWSFTSLSGVLVALATGLIFGGLGSTGPGAVETTGTVVALNGTVDGCQPVATFEVDGTQYTAISVATYSPCSTLVGRTVKVSYQPDDIGGTAVIPVDLGGFNAVPIAIGVGSFLFVAVGVVMIVFGVRLMKKYPSWQSPS